MERQIKTCFYLFLFYYFIIGAISLDLNENSDEIEIYKHLFAKLNKILDGNNIVQKDLSNIKQRLQHLENSFAQQSVTFFNTSSTFNNEEHVLNCNSLSSSLSSETPDNYCFGDRWLIIQKRMDGSENFYRDWNDYKSGFGNKSREFFVGLEKLHQLTSENPHELIIIMQDFDNSKRYAKYNQFEIGSEKEGYYLKTLGAYSGNAGDSLTYHKGSKFSTRERDNDNHPNFNCAEKFQSAWWFKACHESNLNGCYSEASLRDPKSAVACGIHWKTFRGQWYSLKSIEIAIRSKV